MSQAELASRSVPSVPKTLPEIGRWAEKILRQHFLDIKRIYNNEIRSDSFELIKSGNETEQAGNVKFVISGDYLIMQAHNGTEWIATGWKLKIA